MKANAKPAMQDELAARPEAVVAPARPREPRKGGQWLVILAVSFFLLSSWGPLLIRIEGMYAPELAIWACLVYLRISHRQIFQDVLRCATGPVGIVCVAWLGLVAILGVVQTGTMVGPYSEFRSSVILVCTFLYFLLCAGRRPGALVLFHRLAVISLCLEFVFAVFQIVGAARGWITSEEENAVFGVGRVSVPAITIAAAGYLSARRQSMASLLLVVALGATASLGGHRLVLLVTALIALLVPLVGIDILMGRKLARKGIMMGLLVATFALGAVVLQQNWVSDYLDNASGIRYRLFERTQTTLAGLRGGTGGLETLDAGEESIRVAYLYFVTTHSTRLLWPHGLGSREVYGRLGEGFDEVATRFGLDPTIANTHDTSLLYYSYHHGLVAMSLVVICLLALVLRRFARMRGVLDGLMTVICLATVLAVDLFFPSIPGISLCFMYGGLLGTALNPAAFRARAATAGRKLEANGVPA